MNPGDARSSLGLGHSLRNHLSRGRRISQDVPDGPTGRPSHPGLGGSESRGEPCLCLLRGRLSPGHTGTGDAGKQRSERYLQLTVTVHTAPSAGRPPLGPGRPAFKGRGEGRQGGRLPPCASRLLPRGRSLSAPGTEGSSAAGRAAGCRPAPHRCRRDSLALPSLT